MYSPRSSARIAHIRLSILTASAAVLTLAAITIGQITPSGAPCPDTGTAVASCYGMTNEGSSCATLNTQNGGANCNGVTVQWTNFDTFETDYLSNYYASVDGTGYCQTFWQCIVSVADPSKCIQNGAIPPDDEDPQPTYGSEECLAS